MALLNFFNVSIPFRFSELLFCLGKLLFLGGESKEGNYLLNLPYIMAISVSIPDGFYYVVVCLTWGSKTMTDTINKLLGM